MVTVREYRRRSWLDPRVEVRPSAVEGRGLFAREGIPSGERIIEMGGQRHADSDVAGLGPAAHSSLAIDEGRNLIQDADDPGTYGNHSCDPNAWLVDEVTIVARRDIAAGEEITIDYATLSGYEGWTMACACGAGGPGCRRTVGGADWRRPDLQDRYAGHWSPFLERRIARGEATKRASR
jgi:hypothetical protein